MSEKVLNISKIFQQLKNFEETQFQVAKKIDLHNTNSKLEQIFLGFNGFHNNIKPHITKTLE